MEHSRFLEEQRRHVGETYKHATGYTNVVVLAGYAAFFALWTTSRQYLHPQLGSLAALLMTISCSAFVLWQVLTMIRHALLLVQYDGALDNPDPVEALKKYERQRIAVDSVSIKGWARVLGWTIWPAVLAISVAAGAFLYGFVAPSLMGWRGGPGELDRFWRKLGAALRVRPPAALAAT
jgi:hypothetical protein